MSYDAPRLDADVIEQIISAVVERVAGPLSQQLAVNRSAIELRLDAIEQQTRVTTVLAKAAFAKSGAKPGGEVTKPRPGTPRPVAIDVACAEDPGAGTQRVDIAEYGLTMFVRPGSDPQETWETNVAAINSVGREPGAVRRSRRSSRS